MCEKENCRLFDTGRFNDITMAYLIFVLQATETPIEQVKNIVEAWGARLFMKYRRAILSALWG